MNARALRLSSWVLVGCVCAWGGFPVSAGPDSDGDGIADDTDNCPLASNSAQADAETAYFPIQRVVASGVLNVTTIDVRDLDGDGDDDVLFSTAGDPEDGSITTTGWFENLDGLGSCGSAHVIELGGNAPWRTRAVDLDGDTDFDALSVDTPAVWYENLGAGVFGPKHTLPSFVTLASDLDLDGDQDLVRAHHWYENTDGTGLAWLHHSFASGGDVLFPSDIDGDLDIDLVGLRYGSSAGQGVIWLENLDGGGTFSDGHFVGPLVIALEKWIALHAADLDGDGDADVLASDENGAVGWYRNLDGAGSFGPRQLVVGAAVACCGKGEMLAVDLDLDGDRDLVTSSYPTSRISWFENLDGAGGFGPEQLVSTATAGPRSLLAVDFDGDGKLDLASASAEHEISWYPNSADGVGDACDNCVLEPNPAQSDADADLTGDVCDPCTDSDGDGSGDPTFAHNACPTDNCPVSSNPDQSDLDTDGRGDACDNCPGAANGDQLDPDHDGVGSACDLCPLVVDARQTDSDGDGFGDACDNCVESPNLGQGDTDGDGSGDVCDNCPVEANPAQNDIDADLQGDACDIADGLILFEGFAGSTILWQDEAGFGRWNLYRGSFAALVANGTYTQEPGSSSLVERWCGLLQPQQLDEDLPSMGQLAFYLVTGVTQGGEADLGYDSEGNPRPNSFACP